MEVEEEVEMEMETRGVDVGGVKGSKGDSNTMGRNRTARDGRHEVGHGMAWRGDHDVERQRLYMWPKAPHRRHRTGS